MEEFDRRLSKLLEDNRDLLLSSDGDSNWWAYAEACVARRRNLNRRLFDAGRRIRAWPRTCALVILRIVLLAALVVAAAAALRAHLRQAGRLEEAATLINFQLRRASVALELHKSRYVQDQAMSDTPCLVPALLPSWLPAAGAAAKPNRSSSDKPAEQCCLCSFEVRQSKLRNLTAAIANYRTVASRPRPKPFILTNGGVNATYADLRQLYLRHSQQIESSGYNWVNRLGVSHNKEDHPLPGGLAALFADPSGPPAGITVAWRVMHVDAVRLLRRLLPRPAFVAPEMEIGLIRQLVFLGAGWKAGQEAPLRLPREMQNVHLTLLEGEPVLVTLTPRPGCDCPTEVRAVPLQQGELLFYRSSCHSVGIARMGATTPVGFTVLYAASQM